MFPFERLMGVLKKYVHSRSWPERSIAKGCGTEEVIEFYFDFILDLDPIAIPESRYEGRLSEKGTLGKKKYIGTVDDYFNKSQYTVLQNPSLVEPYVEVHKDSYSPSGPRRMELGYCVSTCKLLAIGCAKNVRLMKTLMNNFICWPGNHHGMSSHTKGMR